MTRWGTPKEYAAYCRLISPRGVQEFLWWLERENPALFQLVVKEIARSSSRSTER